MDAAPGPGKSGWLARAGQALIQASEGKGCWSLLLRILSRLTLWSILLYVAGLLLLAAFLKFVGEGNVTSAFLLYLPLSIWWLPAVPLALAGAAFHRKSLLGLILVMAWFALGFVGWRWQSEAAGSSSPAESLRIMTYNRGQHGNQSLQPFKQATRPDVIAFQEAPGRAAGYAAAAEYAEFVSTLSVGEHTLLSRFPIAEGKHLPALPGKSPKAARFVLDWNGRQIAIYSVHLQTPREVLEAQMRGAFLSGILGFPGSPFEGTRKKLQQFWDDQIADAEIVLEQARKDPLPVILAGDFNAPHVGAIHRLITQDFRDSHAEAGAGTGLTFPGSTRNPLSAGGPWLRIDYVFFNQDWKALRCITEQDRPSQHRAVTAELELVLPPG